MPAIPGRHHATIAAGLSASFLVLLALVASGNPTGLDRWLAGHIQALDWGGWHALPHMASEMGGGTLGFFVIPSAVAALLLARRDWPAMVLLAAVFVLHYALISPKLFIEAPRPSPLFGVHGAGGMESFPSGHVQWATSFYGLLAYLASRRFPQCWPAFFAAAALVVAATMLSRIELGRHWPIDTVGGLLVGLVSLELLVLLHARLRSTLPARRRVAAAR